MSFKQKFAELIYLILFAFAVILMTLNLSSCEKDEDCPGGTAFVATGKRLTIHHQVYAGKKKAY